MLSLFSWISSVLGVIVSVLYFTMLERKIMSYIQNRKGPNKVGFLGMLTPVADALKLLGKSFGHPVKSKYLVFWFSPVLSVLLLVLVWFFFPFTNTNISVSFGFLFFLVLSSFQVYGMLGSGWGSNSKYSLLGSLRGAAQIMSYEVCLSFLSFFPFCLLESYNLEDLLDFGLVSFWLFIPSMCWLVVSVAETNRAPLDFSEGESELVSGFNTEYGAMEFACIFLGEYGQMMFLGVLFALLWVPLNMMFVIVFGIAVSLSFIWFRSTFPRFRYDLLMNFAWSIVLPFILLYFFLNLSF